jgi:arylformamidase
MLVQREVTRRPLDLHESGEAWIDVSVPIRAGMLHWPGNPEVVVTQTEHLRRGDLATVSMVSLGVHTATHVDAPNHFLIDGAGVESLGLDGLIGPARVLDMGERARIQPADLEGQGIAAGDRVLLKTRNSRYWKDREFRRDYTALTAEAARWLTERRVRTVGIDYLSIAAMDAAPETHQPLLEAGICVIEGLDLSGVGAGLYDLICLPLRLEGLDGAPARVVLRKAQPSHKAQPSREASRRATSRASSRSATSATASSR